MNKKSNIFDSNPATKTERILAYFREDPTRMNQRMSLTVKACRVSFGLVAKARRIFDPTIPVRSYTQKKARRRGKRLSPPSYALPPELTTTEVTAVIDDPFLSIDRKRQLLRDLAESADVRDEAKISAIRTLHQIDESTGKSQELGPGRPLTADDVVLRLSLLITAAGPDIAREAVRLAKKEWEILGDLKAPSAKEPTTTV